jgi:hypothetical protein
MKVHRIQGSNETVVYFLLEFALQLNRSLGRGFATQKEEVLETIGLYRRDCEVDSVTGTAIATSATAIKQTAPDCQGEARACQSLMTSCSA